MATMKCFQCGCYETEHDAAGVCQTTVIAGCGEHRCRCRGFEPMTLERCERWIMKERKFGRSQGLTTDDRVLMFLLWEVQR